MLSDMSSPYGVVQRATRTVGRVVSRIVRTYVNTACSLSGLCLFFFSFGLFVFLSSFLLFVLCDTALALRGTFVLGGTAGSANVPIVGIKRVGREGNTVSVSAAGRGTIGFEPQVLP